MLNKPGVNGLSPQHQPHYQPVTYDTYWTVLGSFNNWKIITLSQKSTISESFEEIHHIFLDGISDNMASLVQALNYGYINTTKTTAMGYYEINFVL